MQVFKPLPRNVGIDGGRADIGMPQQQLHHSQVGTVIEQMRSKGMSQSMGRQGRMNARLHGIPSDEQPEHRARHGLTRAGATGRNKDTLAHLAGQQYWPRFLQITPQPVMRLFAKRHQPLLVALARNTQHLSGQIHLQ